MKLEDVLPEIRKGRKFKKKKWDYHWGEEMLKTYFNTCCTGEDILADDWELEPVKKEISREDIEKAYYSAANMEKYFESSLLEKKLLEDFCKELGL